MGSGDAAEPLLQVCNLYTQFDTPNGIARVVNGVSFSLEKGKTLGIVGESGSGKSILSRTIIDILAKDGSVQYDGKIIFEGKDLRTLPEKQMREIRGKDIAIVFQDPMSSLNPVKKIGKQITEVLTQHMGMSRHFAKVRAAELVNSVGIPDAEQQLGRYPMHLSGGMRQRIAIAIAIACQPKLLIADEPTTALDVTIQAQILDLLKEQQNKHDMSVILITHNLGIVSGYTDDVAVMYAGKIVEKCSTRELLSQPLMPYTEALMKSAPSLVDPPHTRLHAIPGLPPNVLSLSKGCSFQPRCSYMDKKCVNYVPDLTSLKNPTHMFACWHPLGQSKNPEAIK